MGLVVALGEVARVGHLALGGATVVVAEDPEAALVAWQNLSGDVSVVILTEQAAAAVEDGGKGQERVLRVVMPS